MWPSTTPTTTTTSNPPADAADAHAGRRDGDDVVISAPRKRRGRPPSAPVPAPDGGPPYLPFARMAGHDEVFATTAPTRSGNTSAWLGLPAAWRNLGGARALLRLDGVLIRPIDAAAFDPKTGAVRFDADGGRVEVVGAIVVELLPRAQLFAAWRMRLLADAADLRAVDPALWQRSVDDFVGAGAAPALTDARRAWSEEAAALLSTHGAAAVADRAFAGEAVALDALLLFSLRTDDAAVFRVWRALAQRETTLARIHRRYAAAL